MMHETKPTFVMLVGLPGSGKSTFRGDYGAGAVNLSTDDLIEDAARWQGKTYSEVFSAQIESATTAVWSNFREALRSKSSIIWDQTNLTAKKRRGILAQIPKDYYKICVVVSTDEEVRQKRLTARVGKDIPAHIDQSMRASFAMPTIEEGWDLIREVAT